MNFEQLYAPSLKELFVQKLQGMILSGALPMGEKLPPERELCQQMGVSRAVVNGGITELARQGFLEVRPRQGTYVADYRRQGSMETLMAIMDYNGGMLGREEIRSILEVRWGLEQMTLHRVIDNASDEQLAQLGTFVDRLGEHPTPAQAAAWQAIGSGEHALVIAPTGSGKTLAAFLSALDSLTRPDAEGAGCRVVYVSPLKALAVDVERNLRAPLRGIDSVERILRLNDGSRIPLDDILDLQSAALE